MKTRNDFVSNSSSCSFIIDNLKNLKFDNNFAKIIASASWMQFNNIDLSDGEKEAEKLKSDLKKTFSDKVELRFKKHEDSSDPLDDAYVTIYTDDFPKNCSDKICNLIKKLASSSSEMYLSYGDDCGGGVERATQAATLLDYMYGANIVDDDHFYYFPVEKIGIKQKISSKKL